MAASKPWLADADFATRKFEAPAPVGTAGGRYRYWSGSSLHGVHRCQRPGNIGASGCAAQHHAYRGHPAVRHAFSREIHCLKRYRVVAPRSSDACRTLESSRDQPDPPLCPAITHDLGQLAAPALDRAGVAAADMDTFIRDVIDRDRQTFRLFGPDETSSKSTRCGVRGHRSQCYEVGAVATRGRRRPRSPGWRLLSRSVWAAQVAAGAGRANR